MLNLAAYQVEGTDALVVIEAGLGSQDAETLFQNMMFAAQLSLVPLSQAQAALDASPSAVLWMCYGGDTAASVTRDHLRKAAHSITLCSHPDELLSGPGQNKALAWQALLAFTQRLS